MNPPSTESTDLPEPTTAKTSTPTKDFENYKVVISYQNGGRLCSVLHSRVAEDLGSLLDGSTPPFPGGKATFYTREGDPLAFDLDEVKALFFVNSFKGDRTRKGIRFYENGPEIQDLWVEIQFSDGEVIEGAVSNSIHHLSQPGFFLRPSDPVSNNYLVYINKRALKSFRVLGLRAISMSRVAGR